MTAHFSLNELIFSQAAKDNEINNQPDAEVMKNLLFTMAGLERVRACVNWPLKINSGFRCAELNALVGGSPNSQHMKGEAVDLTCPVLKDPRTLAAFLSGKMQVLGIDQLIREATWVHISFTLNPRYEVLTKTATGYVAGITG